MSRRTKVSKSKNFGEQWTAYMREAVTSPIGNGYLDVCIKFMTEDVLKAVILPDCDARKFTGSMKLLIVLLLDDVKNITSRRFKEISVMKDGSLVIDRVLQRLIDQAAARPADLAKPFQEDSHQLDYVLKSCISKLEEITKAGTLTGIFDVTIGTAYSIESPIFRAMDFKRQIFRNISRTISNTLNPAVIEQIQAFDKYFMSLAIVGPSAADMYGSWDRSAANKTCVIQSLAHPEFDFEQFMESGPISLFNGCAGMMFEIKFVMGSHQDDRLSCNDMVQMYSSRVGGNHWHRWGSRDNMITYLTKCHGVAKKSKRATYEQLKLKLGNKLGNPIEAFTRPF